jgi:hypothetical protein
MNTLTLEHWDTFKTPFWKLKGWDLERVCIEKVMDNERNEK